MKAPRRERLEHLGGPGQGAREEETRTKMKPGVRNSSSRLSAEMIVSLDMCYSLRGEFGDRGVDGPDGWA